MQEAPRRKKTGPVINEPWDSVRYLVALVRNGTLSGAARELNVDHTTVGRRLRDLEARLGVTLFYRQAGKLDLTPTAREIVADAGTIETMVGDLLRRLKDADGRLEGDVRITATYGMAVHWIGPGLAPFLRANPNLRLNLLIAQNEYSNLLSEADIALTWGRPKRPSVVARKLASAPVSIHGVQKYFDRYGKPETREDLASHSLAHCKPYEYIEGFRRWNEIVKEFEPALIVANTTAITPIVTSGEYLAPLPDYVTNVDPRMIRLDIDLDVALDLWVSYDEQAKSSRRVRAVVEEIVHQTEEMKGSWFV